MSDHKAPVLERVADIQAVLASDSIPKEYFNGFNLTIGSGDVLLILMHNSQPVRALQVSYTVAKTLGQALSQSILAFEELTGSEIMTTHYIDEKIKAVANVAS